MKKSIFAFLFLALFSTGFAALAAEPAGTPNLKDKARSAAPCCAVVAINQATGVVTLKDLTSGDISQVTVTDKAKLKSLQVGQQVARNL